MIKCIELSEYIGTMEIDPTDEKLKQWVSRTLRYMRETYMDANRPMSREKFAERAGMGWKSIDNIETGKHFPGIDTLNKIVLAADSNLAEFFSLVVTRMELAAIERNAADERETISTLVRGLSSPRTSDLVKSLARHVAELLDRAEVR